MKSFVQVMGCGNATPAASLYLFFDDKRYIFNAGDGMQRFCTESKIRVTCIDNIFLTRMHPDATGGLPGLIMTMADSGKDGVSVIGGPGLMGYFNSLKHFTRRQNFTLTVTESPATPYSDERVTISPVVVYPHEFQEFSAKGPLSTPSAKRKLEQDTDESFFTQIRSFKHSVDHPAPVVSYICQLHDLPGKFNAARAKRLGIPSGPLCGLLNRGETVTSPNGDVVTPDQCVEPATPGPVFFVIECPTAGHVAGLTGAAAWTPFVNRVCIVFHLTPLSIMSESAYQAWMNGLGPQTEHVTLSAPSPTLFPSVASMQTLLHDLCPDVYLPTIGSATSVDLGALIHGTSMLSYTLSPVRKMGWDRSGVGINVDRVVPSEVEDFKSWYRPRQKSSNESEYEVVFLGTGSALPSKYRNVSSIMLRMQESVMLLDCGEGTHGQLVAAFGDGVDEIIASLSCVFLSHIHADHLLGLLKILTCRSELDLPSLYIYGPGALESWLLEYKLCCGIELRYSFRTHPDFEKLEWSKSGITVAKAIPVPHCPDSYGVVIEHGLGWKIVYSGDCRPCDALIDAGRGATILIHEATFEDELAEEAARKMHSTISEAVGVACKMEAKFLALTHFSQRYPKFPVLNDEQHIAMALASDHMRLSPGNISLFPRLSPIVKAVWEANSEPE